MWCRRCEALRVSASKRHISILPESISQSKSHSRKTQPFPHAQMEKENSVIVDIPTDSTVGQATPLTRENSLP